MKIIILLLLFIFTVQLQAPGSEKSQEAYKNIIIYGNGYKIMVTDGVSKCSYDYGHDTMILKFNKTIK